MKFVARIIVVVLVASMALAGTKGDESYLFPTNASHLINSGFADYRSSHFHGGIDISTNGKIGYPVFASKSGYVYRVSVSPYGYGKMIILRHDDSTYTLYGHLSEFVGEIERRVEAAQQAGGDFNVDLRFLPGEIKVDRGEVIARTGATGVGGPHLHFEIHDRNFGFVDPLVYKSLDVTGYRIPRIFNVALRGFGSGIASVSGVSGGRREYRTRKTFYMREPFFFIIHAADSYGRGRFKRPPKYITLRIDGNDFINLDLTRFSYEDYLDVSSLVDLRLSRGYKTYYKLCVDRAIPFSVFTPSAPLSGLVDGKFSNGTHHFQIVVRDEDGDSADVTGKFVLNLGSRSEFAGGSDGDDPPAMVPFNETVVNPLPGVTLRFKTNSFIRDVSLESSRISATSFILHSDGLRLRKKFLLTWNLTDPGVQLFRRGRRSWIHIPSKTDGKVLTADVGYETGEFALIHDNTPPVVGRVRVSRRNPFYLSVAPTQFKRDFVYFRVFDRLSNINTGDILLRVGTRNFLCEYDADKHAAVCRVDADLLRHERKVEIVVYDNAGNERKLVTKLRF